MPATIKNGSNHHDHELPLQYYLNLIGELELLVLQLPEVGPDDPDPDDIIALRAAILGLVTEIGTGTTDSD